MGAEWPPASPEGYQLHEPDYKQPWYVTMLLFIWLLGVFIAIPSLLVVVHGFETAGVIVRTVLQPDRAGEWVVYLGWVFAVLAGLLGGHEALHALAARWFGLRTRVRFHYENPVSWSPEVVAYGGFQSRGESLAIVLAPLVVLTSANLFALVASQHLWVVATATILALGNSASAVGDLASAWVLWKLPAGELIAHDKDGRRQYYLLKA